VAHGREKGGGGLRGKGGQLEEQVLEGAGILRAKLSTQSIVPCHSTVMQITKSKIRMFERRRFIFI